MIFQEPMKALTPVLSIGYQIIEAIRRHQKVSRRAAYKQALDLLELVGIYGGDDTMARFPFELSGGMCQRVMIAIALSCNPKVLIADEPTTGLDVTIQAQVLHLIRRLQKQLSTAVVLITHDLGVIAQFTDELVVMYCGHVVEKGSTVDVLQEPMHPYTKGLLASTPRWQGGTQKTLQVIEGSVPPLSQLPTGCRFHDRCPLAAAHCQQQAPPLREQADNHHAACWEV